MRVQDTQLTNISQKSPHNYLLSDVPRAVGRKNLLTSVSRACICSAFLKILPMTYDLPF